MVLLPLPPWGSMRVQGYRLQGGRGGFQVCGSWSRLVTSLPRCAVPGGVCVLWLCALGRALWRAHFPRDLVTFEGIGRDRARSTTHGSQGSLHPPPARLREKIRFSPVCSHPPFPNPPSGAWASRKQQPGGERLASLYSATQKWGWGT